MPYEQVISIDKLADEINTEVSELAFGLEPDYDWKLVDLLLESQKTVNNFIDSILSTGEDNNARIALRKLRSRMYKGTEQFKKVADKAKISDAQISSLKATTNSITQEEVMKMDSLGDEINTEVGEITLMNTGGATPRNEAEYDWHLADLVLDA